MAIEAVVVTAFREKIAAHLAGKGTLKPIRFMAFGVGGHDSDGNPIMPAEGQTALKDERLRKELSVITQEDTLSVTGTGVIEKAEMVDMALSEAGLLDADGELVAVKNFAPKIKEADERYECSMLVRF
jgi:phage-related tail fiber protein|uniref:Tail-collar fiber protein n=1 Tax=Myoviridae sp. ctZhz2 TaxID=2825129 RepID=A0A8S5U8M9_9CAUD|nr:MAG TPA: tail-collar fiber protein [Myoviridae sp. ctZhz2]DAI71758.1 MAG TPA: tail-collar fiber protein [Caudoviricetes sp.]